MSKFFAPHYNTTISLLYREILNANANARVSTRKTRAKPAFKTVNTSVLATRRTWQAVEDPLADVVYKSAHQRRIKFDIWQNDRLLLEFAVEDHEDFEARFQALRDKLVALRTGPMNESEKWYEALEMRMAKIRARARIVLQRGGTSYMGANRKKSWTSSPGGSSEEGEPGSSSLRQSVAVMTEDNGESVGEEDESAEEWEDEVSGDEGWGSEYDASDEEDTDEESEDSAIDDNDDDDYH